MKKNLFIISVLILSLQFISCAKKTEQTPVNEIKESGTKTKITFLELGSLTCIPCKQMQPVMKSIEAKYGGQVKIIFYDVWKDRRPAQQYGIKLIPTQVFLDESGKEILRHEGFFPEAEIDKFLQAQGLKIIN